MFEVGQKVILKKNQNDFKFNNLECVITFVSELHSTLIVQTFFDNEKYSIVVKFEEVELVSVA